MTYALSIDVGTTFTAAATWRDGTAAPVTLGDEADAVPSVLFLREDGTLLVGEAAERRALADPSRVAREFKRRMGDEQSLLLGTSSFSPQELTGDVLSWVVGKVVEQQGARPDHVVLTCPAAWGDYRRSLMVAAAGIGGLASAGLLSEPEAAVTYYASVRSIAPDDVVAVYDFGGGTFDCAVVRKTADGLEMVGEPGGDDQVGGSDFDFAVLQHVLAAAGIGDDLDLSDPTVRRAAAALRASAVDAKKALTSDVVVDIPVSFPAVRTTVRLTRDEFEASIRDAVQRTVATFSRTLEEGGVDPAELRGVLLVGGSSRIPLVARTIAAELGTPTLVDTHPKHTVCLGAAVAAAARVSSPTVRPAALRDAARSMFVPVPEGKELEAEPDVLVVEPDEVGITTPLDTAFVPVVRRRPTPVTARDEPLVVRFSEGTTSTRPVKVLALILTIVVVLVAVLTLVRPR